MFQSLFTITMMSYIKVCFYDSLILTTCFHDSVKSNIRIDRTCFKQIFAISHIGRDQIKYENLSMRLDRVPRSQIKFRDLFIDNMTLDNDLGLNLYIMPTVLQFSNLKVDQRRKPCIRVNTRELNREFCIRLSILYTTGSESVACPKQLCVCLKVSMY